MIISLKNTEEGQAVTVNAIETFDVPESYGLTENAVSCDVRATIVKRGDGYDMKGTIAARVFLLCARCLRETVFDILAEIDERLITAAGEDIDDDVIYVKNEVIDIKPALKAALLLNIPMKTLCGDDCKGLCEKCGFNLNDGAHGDCEKEIDPRLAKLSQIQKEV
ncbi:MAG: DUF177 domain-containing protein [Clostridiales bacterium]|jgi:uncharacterized protein|nr:DUF177 domain-containing protein [Clostridiales bacterium]